MNILLIILTVFGNLASIVAAFASVYVIVQSRKPRRARFAFSVKRDDPSDPEIGKGTDYTVACNNEGLAAAKVKDLLLVIPGRDKFAIRSSLQGRDNALPKFVAPGDGFELGFTDTKLVGGEGIPETAFLRVELTGGARQDSAPFHELLGKLGVDEQPLPAQTTAAAAFAPAQPEQKKNRA